ncbi:MAG: hypothetical protein ACLFVO_27485 [Chloroflexaceae bacterium]
MASLTTVEQILAAAQHLSVADKLWLIARLNLDLEQATNVATPIADETTGQPLITDAASAASLLDVAGTWAGDDFDACLQMVYATRQPITECTCNNPA